MFEWKKAYTNPRLSASVSGPTTSKLSQKFQNHVSFATFNRQDM